MKAIRNILVGTDFSTASRAAFRHALDLASANEAALWIAHVAVPPVPALPRGIRAAAFLRRHGPVAIRADAQRRLRPLLNRARKAGVRARALTLVGAPDDALNRAARRHRADLIVVGTHGRTGLARFFVGSVASRVVATAPCPVITIRGR